MSNNRHAVAENACVNAGKWGYDKLLKDESEVEKHGAEEVNMNSESVAPVTL